MAVDYTVIVVYLAGMLAMGWWGMRRAKSRASSSWRAAGSAR